MTLQLCGLLVTVHSQMERGHPLGCVPALSSAAGGRAGLCPRQSSHLPVSHSHLHVGCVCVDRGHCVHKAFLWTSHRARTLSVMWPPTKGSAWAGVHEHMMVSQIDIWQLYESLDKWLASLSQTHSRTYHWWGFQALRPACPHGPSTNFLTLEHP